MTMAMTMAMNQEAVNPAPETIIPRKIFMEESLSNLAVSISRVSEVVQHLRVIGSIIP